MDLIEVSVVTLDDLLENYFPKNMHIDVLKIDCEQVTGVRG